MTYITRDKIKFKKDGGSETATAAQTIDLTEIDAVVDGKVLGLKKLEAQELEAQALEAQVLHQKQNVDNVPKRQRSLPWASSGVSVSRTLSGNPFIPIQSAKKCIVYFKGILRFSMKRIILIRIFYPMTINLRRRHAMMLSSLMRFKTSRIVNYL